MRKSSNVVRGGWFAVVMAAVALGGCKPKVLSPKLDPNPKKLNFTVYFEPFMVNNGLTVVLVPEENTNLVQVDLRLKIGSTADPEGKEGLAHVVEHVLFTVKPKPELAASLGLPADAALGDALNAMSLQHNAYTTWEETHYTSTALEGKLDKLIAIERARLGTTCDDVSAEAVAREVKVVQEELREREIADGDMHSALIGLLFTDHPLERPVGGTVDTVGTITRDDVCQFLGKYYGPSNAILVVSGNYESKRLRPFVGKLFHSLPKRQVASAPDLTPLYFPKATQMKVGVDHKTLIATFARPNWGTSDATATQLIDELFAGNWARLDDSVKWVRSAQSATLGGYKARAMAVALTVDSDVDLKKALALIDKTVKATQESIFKGTRKTAQARVLRVNEPFSSRAYRVADYFQFAPHTKLMINDLEVLENVTDARLKAAVPKLFATRRVLWLVPSGKKDKRDVTAAVKRGSVSRPFDVESWREPVDASKAMVPLEMPATPTGFGARHETLDNGIELIMVSDLSYPLVDIRVVVPAGELNDPPGKEGTAKLTAYLLSPDLRDMRGRSDLAEIERIFYMGYEFDTEVGSDATSFHIRGAAPYARGYLWLLYYILQRGDFDDDAVAKAVKVVSSSKEARGSAFLEALYGKGHPLARRATFSKSIDDDDLSAFRDRFYRTEGMKVIVTGRFESEPVRAQVKRLFASLTGAGKAPPAVVIPPVRPRTKPTYLASIDEEADQLRVSIALPTPPGFRAQAMRAVLKEVLKSRLESIRAKLGASYGVTVLAISQRGPGALYITADVDPGRAGEVLQLMMGELRALRTGGEMEEDFVRARRRVFEQFAGSSVDSDSAGDRLEFASTYGLGDNYAAKIAGQVAAMTVDKFVAQLADELPLPSAVIQLSGRSARVKEVYKQAGVTEYKSGN